ncbi:MAG: fructose-6-phosphate aldolase [Bacteroidota bacterium]
MFILKIQGTQKIPDYIQIRDENFTLIAYFKVTNPKTALTRCNLLDKMNKILAIASQLEYGKIRKLEL